MFHLDWSLGCGSLNTSLAMQWILVHSQLVHQPSCLEPVGCFALPTYCDHLPNDLANIHLGCILEYSCSLNLGESEYNYFDALLLLFGIGHIEHFRSNCTLCVQCGKWPNPSNNPNVSCRNRLVMLCVQCPTWWYIESLHTFSFGTFV